MIYHCCDPRRRELVDAHATLNGIDYVEVIDGDAPLNTPRQRTLLIRFLKPAPALGADNIEIVGGERVTDVGIEWVMRADSLDLSEIDPIEAALPGFLGGLPEPDHVVVVRTDSAGDHSTYRLRLVVTQQSLSPPDGIDRILSEVAFSFKVECPTDFDCAPTFDCDVDVEPLPALSYLAKDFQSFRRLMLGRMAQLSPDWRERNPADLGIALVETLAYTADRLSYAQDAVATEAYLATARRRSSIRRHARLVDYFMHDGANARVWIHVEVEIDGVTIRPTDERFFTRLAGTEVVVAPADEQRALDRRPLVFEPLHEKELFRDHNDIDFYDWGGAECSLPAGATRATLAEDLPDLAIGDVLLFIERVGPRTGREADANPTNRHAVMITAVESGLVDDLTGQSITEIRWADEDGLPFPLCISSRLDQSVGGGLVTRVSHAVGNIVLADHGRTILDEDLGFVPQPHLTLVSVGGGDPCDRPEQTAVPARFSPRLAEGPISQAERWPVASPPLSAFSAISSEVSERRPEVELNGVTPSTTRGWVARRDLLHSFGNDTHFVVEVEHNGAAHLRFGDDRNGLRPASGTEFAATYRVGNGSTGNVGATAIRHVVSLQGGITAVSNPMAAQGGADPETAEEVRRAAPYAYRRQERAVTPADYAEVARRHADVQRAEATFRWNGHGHTVFVTVDRFAGRPVTAEFEIELRAFLERFRMAGYDLEIDAPRFVPIELGLFVCAGPDHFRSEIRREVFEVLSSSTSARGPGLFHPDNFSFGQPVFLSTIYSAVMSVEGVTSVEATKFERRGRPGVVSLLDGMLEVGRLEIAQLDHDPNFPERGSIEVEMGGGK